MHSSSHDVPVIYFILICMLNSKPLPMALEEMRRHMRPRVVELYQEQTPAGKAVDLEKQADGG